VGLALGHDSQGIELVVLVPSGLRKRRDIRDMCNGGTVKNTGSFTDRNADERWADVVTPSEGLVESRKVGLRLVGGARSCGERCRGQKRVSSIGNPLREAGE
jgi:hypothetical protein